MTVVAAVPYDSPQLPKHARRRWFLEAPRALLADAAETWFIRLSRWGFPLLVIAVIAYAIARYYGYAP